MGEGWDLDYDDEPGLPEAPDFLSDAAAVTAQIDFIDNFELDVIDHHELSLIDNETIPVASPRERPDVSINEERGNLSNLDQVIAQAISGIPECLAGGVVDLRRGILVGVKTVSSHPKEVLGMLSAATHDLFQGQNVVTIEKMFNKARGVEMDDYPHFKEIIVNSKNLIHIFIRGKQNPDYVVSFVCRLSANFGMVLMKSRAQVPIIEKAVCG